MKKMKTSKRFRVYKEARRQLNESYPLAFPAKGCRPPLRVGILKDIVGSGDVSVSATRVRVFLSVWTRSTSYLRSVAKRKDRIGLDGIACGDVSLPNAREAARIVEERKKRGRKFDSAR